MNKIIFKSLVCLAPMFELTACAQVTPTATPLPTGTPIPAPTETITTTASLTLIPEPTATASLIPIPTPHPAQVFAEPILAAVAQVQPFFADDFSINRGWSQNIYGHLRIEAELVKATGQGGKFLPPHVDSFSQKDFVLALDVRLLNVGTQFGAGFRNNHTRAVSYAFYLMNSGEWLFESVKREQIGGAAPTYTEQKIASGAASNFQPGEMNHLVIIARGNQFAAYLNNLPLFYAEDNVQPKAGLCISLGLDGGEQNVMGELDNLQFWDLDQVQGLP